MNLDLKIDEFGRTFIVEACDNHFGSLDLAKAFIDGAELIGAQYVKFQHHLRHEEMDETEEMSPNFSEPLHKFLDRCSLSLGNHKILIEYCNNKNIDYLCTPFSFKAFQELYFLGQRLFKIGSGEFQDLLFLSKLSSFEDCKFIFSTGMCTEEEIVSNVKYLKKNNFKFALMNCISEYPPKSNNPNFRYIEKLRLLFPDITIGQSDHSPSIGSTLGAITLGAEIIEKHVTLNNLLSGPDKDVSITFDEFERLIDLSKDISPNKYHKLITKNEEIVRKWAYRGLVASKDLDQGELINIDSLESKRPNKGIPSSSFRNTIGAKTKKRIMKGERIYWEDLIL